VALGPTHWGWRPDVAENARRIMAAFPRTRCNTYVAHPWPGWDSRSIDVWFEGGRGDPLPLELALRVHAFAFNMRGAPHLRHTIVEHRLWTSFGGPSHWSAADHTGRLRHVHLTYW
jgi:hypothetical protein